MTAVSTVEKNKDSIAEITSDPISSLITNQTEWDTLNFESSRPDLELIFTLCGHLESLPIEIVPKKTAVTFLNAINAS
ncbi:hypothetical protein [Polynucleobacter sphagniphilus]|uniref:hypothetical protein n=1 Tax=Polynucleobacter sphagniphilus TaxID=1743169 RepID=UPI002406491B|nr:hypothetical protein [Polynucleobacter sphagniphilus]MDF9787862.1 hypothetical protein [Polynucleobacter sphagniphilus]